MKPDRQRQRRARAERRRAGVRVLPPQHCCPTCGSRMGRWYGRLAPGQKAMCGNGHGWVGSEPGPTVTV